MSNTAGVLWEAGTAYSSRAHEFTTVVLVGSMLLIFLVVCVLILCVLTFGVPCCDVRYDFRIKTMLGSYLPPVVCYDYKSTKNYLTPHYRPPWKAVHWGPHLHNHSYIHCIGTYFQQSQRLSIKTTCHAQHTYICMGPLCSWVPGQLSSVSIF
jgi:hypothetical protein